MNGLREYKNTLRPILKKKKLFKEIFINSLVYYQRRKSPIKIYEKQSFIFLIKIFRSTFQTCFSRLRKLSHTSTLPRERDRAIYLVIFLLLFTFIHIFFAYISSQKSFFWFHKCVTQICVILKSA